MSGLAIVTVLLGVLIVATRAPMIFAPAATARAYRRMISTDAKVRVIGLAGAWLGPILAWQARDVPGTPAHVLEIYGWCLAVVGPLLLVFPSAYRRMALSMIDELAEIGWIMGLVGVAFGVGLVWLGFALP